uniref:Coiled-coil domain-containing protein n=2 Tax=Panagrellus redivivus TaxID=6233 RepID=A0A7E4VPV2_PANRE
MQQYYFKLMTSLFQLQRELDKLQVKAVGTSELDESSKVALTEGWHKVSHILGDLSQQQRKFVSQKAVLTNLFDEPIGFTEIEKNWINREIQLQKSRQTSLEHAIDKAFDNRKAIGNAIMTEVEKTESLLQKYAEVESKNMAIDLRNARLTVLGQAMKFEPDCPMYQRFQESIEATTDKRDSEAFKALYERKKESADKSFAESEVAAANLRRMKVKVRDSIARNKPSNLFEINSQQISEFNSNVVEKMNFRTAKEILRSLMLKNDINIETKNMSPLPDDIMAGRLMEASNKYSNQRHHMFEEHLMAALNALKSDNNAISSGNTDLENEISAIEKSIDVEKVEIEKEKELCEKLKQRIVNAEAILEAKSIEKKSEEAEQDAQWELEMEKLEGVYAEALEAREKLKTEKLATEDAIRQAKIDENNLRHRYNVFVGLKREKLNEESTNKKSEEMVEQTKKSNEVLQAEVDELSELLKMAQQQETAMAAKLQKITVQKTSSSARKTLEAQKQELEAEMLHLETLLSKVEQ